MCGPRRRRASSPRARHRPARPARASRQDRAPGPRDHARAPTSSSACARTPCTRRAPGGAAGRASARRGGSPAELLPHRARALDERGELLPHDPGRRLPEAAIGVEPELVGRDGLEQPPDALGDLGRRLGAERLHVDDAGAELLVGRELLPEPDVVQAAVGILEHDLRGREIVQRGIDIAKVAHRSEGPTVQVAEADVDRDLRVHAIDGAVHALLNWGAEPAYMPLWGSSIWMKSQPAATSARHSTLTIATRSASSVSLSL